MAFYLVVSEIIATFANRKKQILKPIRTGRQPISGIKTMKIYILREVELGENNFTKDIRTVAYCESPEAVWNYLTKDEKSHDTVSIVGHTRNDKGYLISCFESENITIKVHSEGGDNPLLGVEFDDYDTYYRITPVDTFKTFFNR